MIPIKPDDQNSFSPSTKKKQLGEIYNNTHFISEKLRVAIVFIINLFMSLNCNSRFKRSNIKPRIPKEYLKTTWIDDLIIFILCDNIIEIENSSWDDSKIL